MASFPLFHLNENDSGKNTKVHIGQLLGKSNFL